MSAEVDVADNRVEATDLEYLGELTLGKIANDPRIASRGISVEFVQRAGILNLAHVLNATALSEFRNFALSVFAQALGDPF